jgi:NDP-sugar pyrophosphorylase family protein
MRSPLQTFGALIMAGGSGTRMGALTLSIPKPLLTIGNYTTLDYLLGSLEYNGILRKNIVVVAKYLADQIYSHLSNTGIRVCTGKHDEIVLNLLDALQYLPDHFIATGCDLYSSDLLSESMDAHIDSNASATLVLCKLPQNAANRKDWLYTIKDGFLKGLDKGAQATDIERDILILKRDDITVVAERIDQIVNSCSSEYETYRKYSTSWNLLLKLLIEQGFRIRILEKEVCRCHRINIPDDLRIAKSIVTEWDLIPISRC